MASAVSASHLTKQYGSFIAVNAIDFDIPHGVCYGILGPNGAGKTTTIRMISCRFAPDQGQLRVLGMDVTTHAKQIKSKLGLVPQENNLDEDLTLLENLELYGRYFGLPLRDVQTRARELIELMQLTPKTHDQIKSLSGGMIRRAMIARALINNPELVILDEPTTGLDPQARVLLWDRLRELKRQGVTLLLTTHYMDEAQRLCDEMIIMHEGNIIDRASPQQLVERHVGYWAAEIELMGQQNHQVASLIPQHVRHWELTGNILHIYADDDQMLMHFLGHIQHTSYQIRPANLEDVFLVRTGREIRE